MNRCNKKSRQHGYWEHKYPKDKLWYKKTYNNGILLGYREGYNTNGKIGYKQICI